MEWGEVFFQDPWIGICLYPQLDMLTDVGKVYSNRGSLGDFLRMITQKFLDWVIWYPLEERVPMGLKVYLNLGISISNWDSVFDWLRQKPLQHTNIPDWEPFISLLVGEGSNWGKSIHHYGYMVYPNMGISVPQFGYKYTQSENKYAPKMACLTATKAEAITAHGYTLIGFQSGISIPSWDSFNGGIGT